MENQAVSSSTLTPSSQRQMALNSPFLIRTRPCSRSSRYSPSSSQSDPILFLYAPFLRPLSQLAQRYWDFPCKIPSPCLSLFQKQPSNTQFQSLLQVILHLPCFMSSLNSPSYIASPAFRIPLPFFLPSEKCPSQQSPLTLLRMPRPWKRLPLMPPRQVEPPARWMLQSQSYRTSLLYLPQQISPSPYLNCPRPCFLPSTKCPQYSSLFSRSFNLPYPWNIPSTKSPSYQTLGTPFSHVLRCPLPWYIPILKTPLQVVPSLYLSSPVPSNLSSLKQPQQRFPSFEIQIPLPVLAPPSIEPQQLEPSAQFILPWRKRLSLNRPDCSYLLVLSLPLPLYLWSLMLPWYESPFFFVMIAKVQSPSSKVPWRESPLAQKMRPWPCSLPASLTSPSQQLPSKQVTLLVFPPIRQFQQIQQQRNS